MKRVKMKGIKVKKAFLFLLLFLTLLPGLGGCTVVRGNFTKEYQLQGASRLRIVTRNGSVKVTGWHENYLHLRVTWMVQGETGNELSEYGKEIEVIPNWQGDLLALTVSYPSLPPYIHSAGVSLELKVPREKIEEIMVETSNGALGFYNLRSALTGRSSNGRITVEDCEGEIDLATTNGRVILSRLRFHGEKGRVVTTNGGIEADVMFPRTGYFLLRTTNGPVDLKLPSWTQGTLRLETSNGRILLDQMPAAVILRSEKDLMEIRLHGGGIYLEVETSNGNINLGESEYLYPPAPVTPI
ncbi:MAG: DUF4097 domain-containing protein [Firmicutes bacterium]|nr:DUF4097 domain-containing protein [Bacillota bacterium]